MHSPSVARVLVFGFVNMNVIDGSAFFVSSLTSMLATDPGVHVDILLANPVKRTLVYRDILGRTNISIIDPFSVTNKRFEPWTSEGSLDHYSAAKVVEAAAESGDYDLIIIRSTEVATHLAEISPKLANRTMLYVTGVVSEKRELTNQLVSGLGKCVDAGMELLCQTPEMSKRISEIPGIEIQPILLPPMIPNGPSQEESLLARTQGARKFIYTGKFARDWKPAEILSGFLEVQYTHRELSLIVAGDQFKKDEVGDDYLTKVKFLLKSSPGIEWVGGVDRSRARELIVESDIGISWRGTELDDSLELSTKLLEYGSFGRPCIMNRTPMHERLFGEDYPLFANSMREFVTALETAATDVAAYELAAQRSFDVSQQYTYSSSFDRFLPHLAAHVARVRSLEASGVDIKEMTAIPNGPFSVVTSNEISYLDLRRTHLQHSVIDRTGKACDLGSLIAAVGPIAVFSRNSTQPEIGFESFLASRLPEINSFSIEDQRESERLSMGERGEADLLKAALQRADRELDKATRAKIVAVGAAHREFRDERSELKSRQQMEVANLRSELRDLESKHEAKAAQLEAEILKLRSAKAHRIQVMYWRMINRVLRRY